MIIVEYSTRMIMLQNEIDTQTLLELWFFFSFFQIFIKWYCNLLHEMTFIFAHTSCPFVICCCNYLLCCLFLRRQCLFLYLDLDLFWSMPTFSLLISISHNTKYPRSIWILILNPIGNGSDRIGSDLFLLLLLRSNLRSLFLFWLVVVGSLHCAPLHSLSLLSSLVFVTLSLSLTLLLLLLLRAVICFER